MVNHKIINLGDPTDDIDAVNEQFFEQEIQISHKNQVIKQTSSLI